MPLIDDIEALIAANDPPRLNPIERYQLMRGLMKNGKGIAADKTKSISWASKVARRKGNRGRWTEFLAGCNPPEVINPANPDDPLDTGTMEGEPEVFTPSGAGRKNRRQCLFAVRMLRAYSHDNQRAESLDPQFATANAGETVEAMRSRIITEVLAEKNAEIGDDDTEEEN